MKKILIQIKTIVSNLILSIEFLLLLIFKENFVNYIDDTLKSKINAKRIVNILANGPSLNAYLKEIDYNNLSNDFCVVNFFANDPSFLRIRPSIYVLTDPMFRANNCHKEKVLVLYKTLNSIVDWPMNLYIKYTDIKLIKKQINNKNIKIVPIHGIVYKGFSSIRNWLFKRGIASADYGTVVHHCIHICLNLNFKEINLYGVDHNFFEGLCVTEKNQVCRKTMHFYDDSEPIIQPIHHQYTGEFVPFTMSFFLYDHMRIFMGHEIMQQYAQYRGVSIINRTKGSMIDAYIKK